MNVQIFWVHAMECMCAQTRPWFILPSKTVYLGNRVKTHVNYKGKISPLLEKLSSEEDGTPAAASSRTANPTSYQWPIPAPGLGSMAKPQMKKRTDEAESNDNPKYRLESPVPAPSYWSSLRDCTVLLPAVHIQPAAAFQDAKWNCLVGLVVKAPASKAENPGFNPACAAVLFPGQVTPATKQSALQWLSCQAPGVTGSAPGLVGLVSVYCDWVRSEQIRPWDTLTRCWDVKQPTNNNNSTKWSDAIRSWNYRRHAYRGHTAEHRRSVHWPCKIRWTRNPNNYTEGGVCPGFNGRPNLTMPWFLLSVMQSMKELNKPWREACHGRSKQIS